jgi:hypothetical protein
MAYDGAGTFNLVYNWEADRDAGIAISAPRMDAQEADIATGLSTAITKDGQTTITANIPMNAHKITGLANGTLVQDAATVGQVQSAAPGGKNLLANGDFRLWQRLGWSLGGLSVQATTAAGQYTCDRWFTRRTTSVLYTLSQIGTSVSSAPVRTQMKMLRVAADTGTETITIGQSIDLYDVMGALAWGLNNNAGVGNYLQFSAYVQKGANFSGTQVTMEILYSTSTEQNIITGSGWTNVATKQILAAALTNGIYNRFVCSVDWSGIPSTAKSIGVRISYIPVGTAGADDSISFTGCLLENTVTPWDGTTPNASLIRAYPYETMAENLARCQRYFQSNINPDTAPVNGLSTGYYPMGIAYVANTIRGSVLLPRTMRTTPTITFYRSADGGSNGQPAYFAGGAFSNGSAVATVGGNQASFSFSFTAVRAVDLATMISVNWVADAEF